MRYSATLTITVPASLYDTACAIARALDPDVGGANSFGPQIDGAKTYTTSTPCTPEFASQVPLLLADPEALLALVAADYADRWPDLTAPTLDECNAFCAGVVVVGDSKE